MKAKRFKGERHRQRAAGETKVEDCQFEFVYTFKIHPLMSQLQRNTASHKLNQRLGIFLQTHRHPHKNQQSAVPLLFILLCIEAIHIPEISQCTVKHDHCALELNTGNSSK